MIHEVMQKDLSIDEHRCLPDRWPGAVAGGVNHPPQRKSSLVVPAPPPEELQLPQVPEARVANPAG
jgi:hypothetical protein